MIDPVLYKDLEAKDPGEVTHRCHAAYDPVPCAYEVRFWDRIVRVTPAEKRVTWDKGPFSEGFDYVPLIAVHYLLSAGKACDETDWVSEKDLPGGAGFFRGPHLLPVNFVAERFEGRLQEFKSVCSKLGGTPLDMADAAFSFPLLPGVPGAVLFWDADDLFGADAKLLFDRTVSRHFALDIVYALGVTLCRVLSEAGKG